MRGTIRVLASIVGATLATGAIAETRGGLTQQVREAENAFAATMAARDLEAFASFLAEDAIFFGRGAIRGKAAIIEAWKPFYEGPEAPFSWKSETVEVLDSGRLAYSSGPVFDAKGNRTATFNSVWRREPDGSWKVVFDKGCEACNCGKQ